MSPILTDRQAPHIATFPQAAETTRVFETAAWHGLTWLVFANAVGVLIAVLLLAPGLNQMLGEWTYGRWMPVHMNLQLYGWISLPLIAFLFKVYGADRGTAALWCRPVLWAWSCALGVGGLAWLSGHSSGKLFLDWTGFARVLFPLAQLALWGLLAFALVTGWRGSLQRNLPKIAGLVILLAVPFLIYIAADPSIYPPINPDSGGPTGASQLESTLVIVAVLLLIPFGLTRRNQASRWRISVAWVVLALESMLCLGLGRTDISHHRPTQYLSLGSLLIWLPLTPIYYSAFIWNPNTRQWRIAFLCWWTVLVPMGWSLFLPGVLDRFKFTDGLVGHSLAAMAGFVTSLLIFVLIQLLGEGSWIFTKAWSFYLWHFSVGAYALLMFAAGSREGTNPAFSMVPGATRNLIYSGRLALGVCMFLASLEWLDACSRLVATRRQIPEPQ